MSSLESNLITTYNFNGRDHLIKMDTMSDLLELSITDKQTGEQWQCCYDITYIETLTKKTGNFKQFEIFITMLKSGLLKTTDCINLDLLTIEDLEILKKGKFGGKSKSSHRLFTGNSNTNNNKRYLIVTYSVEFDKIYYPLPMDYSGLPDPVILQTTIKRLELELAKANERLQNDSSSENYKRRNKVLQKRVEELLLENLQLKDQLRQIGTTKSGSGRKTRSQVEVLQKAISQLEKNVITERNSHHKLVEKLQGEKVLLNKELEKIRVSERSLKAKLRELPNSSKICERNYNTETNNSKQNNKYKLTKSSHRSSSINRKANVNSRSSSIASKHEKKRGRRRQHIETYSNKSGKSRNSSKSSKHERSSYASSSGSFITNLSDFDLPSTRHRSPIHSIHSRSCSMESRKLKSTRKKETNINGKSAVSPLQSPRDELAKLEAQIQKIYYNQKISNFE